MSNTDYNKRTHQTVSIPRALLEEIKIIIEENPQLGYTSHTEFCNEAIRLHLKETKDCVRFGSKD